MARFTVLLYPEEGGYSVIIPLLHVATEGNTLEEAMAMAQEVAELRVAALVEDGEPVLEEEEPPIVASIKVKVPVPASA